MNTGIYAIKNLRTGEHYVGQTSRPFPVRRAEHFARLRAGTHQSKLLQKDWNRYGERAFSFTILERSTTRLDELETEWIQRLRAEYNTLKRAKKPAANWDGFLSFASLAVGAAIGVVWLAG